MGLLDVFATRSALHTKIEELEEVCYKQAVALRESMERVEELEESNRKYQRQAATVVAQSQAIGSLTRDVDRLESQMLNAACAMASSLYGPDAEPDYEGRTVCPKWWARASRRADSLRTQYRGLWRVSQLLRGWLENLVDAHQGFEDSAVILEGGREPGSRHFGVVRLGELKSALRTIKESETPSRTE